MKKVLGGRALVISVVAGAHELRKPAFDLSDVVRQRCTVGTAVSWSALAARSSGLLGRAERSSPNAA